MLRNGLVASLGQSLGVGAPEQPLTVEDYLSVNDTRVLSEIPPNPVLDEPEGPPLGYPETAGAVPDDYGMEALSGGFVEPELPQGPESGLTPEDRAALQDFIAERAKARSARSEHFQAKARELVSGKLGP